MGLTVKNKHKSKPEPEDIYIGRGSVLGNPFTHLEVENTKAQYKCESREQSIETYEQYIRKKIEEKDLKVCGELNRIFFLAEKGNVNLVCFCKPKSCHGDIIKKIVEEKINRATLPKNALLYILPTTKAKAKKLEAELIRKHQPPKNTYQPTITYSTPQYFENVEMPRWEGPAPF